MAEWSIVDSLLENMGVGPEIILPVQMVGRPTPSAEMRLVLAVLEDAIRIFLKWDQRGKKPPSYFEAIEWFQREDTLPFSFLNICDSVGIDAAAFRTRLANKQIVVPTRRQHAQIASPTEKSIRRRRAA